MSKKDVYDLVLRIDSIIIILQERIGKKDNEKFY